MVRSAINKVKTPGDAVAKDEGRETILPTILCHILFTSVQLSAVLEPCMCRRNPVCVTPVYAAAVDQFMPAWVHREARGPMRQCLVTLGFKQPRPSWHSPLAQHGRFPHSE